MTKKSSKGKGSVSIDCSEDLLDLEKYLKTTDLTWEWQDDEDCAIINIWISSDEIPDEVWEALNKPIPSTANPMERSDIKEERGEAFCEHFGINYHHVIDLRY